MTSNADWSRPVGCRRNCDEHTPADVATGSETITLLRWEAAGRELLAAGAQSNPDVLRAALATMPASFAAADTQMTLLHALAANKEPDFAVTVRGVSRVSPLVCCR